jgi:hypothetical protein
MKRILVLVLAAACGSSSPPAQPTTPPPTEVATPASTGLLGIGEITVKESGKDMLAVHANGDVQIFDQNAWKPIGKLSADGKLVTSDGKVGQLQADGSFTTPEGPAPFKLDGAALVAGGTRLTIDGGKLVGGNDSANAIAITGADNDGTKRTTLLLLGLLLSSQPEPTAATGSAVSAPGK